MIKRMLKIEYVVLNCGGFHIVSAWRQDTGFQFGDFKSVQSMKDYLRGLYSLNRLVFIRVYEKEGKNED